MFRLCCSVQCMRRATTELGNKKADTVKNEEPLKVQRCDNWQWLDMKPSTFFHAYENGGQVAVTRRPAGDAEAPLLKLKDYPPTASFCSVLPRHLQVRVAVGAASSSSHTSVTCYLQIVTARVPHRLWA